MDVAPLGCASDDRRQLALLDFCTIISSLQLFCVQETIGAVDLSWLHVSFLPKRIKNYRVAMTLFVLLALQISQMSIFFRCT